MEKVAKNTFEESYQQKVMEKLSFSLLLMCGKFSSCNFLGWITLYFFQHIEISIKFCILKYPYRKFVIQNFLITFCQLWSHTRTKQLRKTKNLFSKCVSHSIPVCLHFRSLKVWWPYATLFAFIFLFVQEIHSYFIYSWILIHGVPSPRLELGPYSKPANYQLSHAAPILDLEAFILSKRSKWLFILHGRLNPGDNKAIANS